jgi:hypothetical protein
MTLHKYKRNDVFRGCWDATSARSLKTGVHTCLWMVPKYKHTHTHTYTRIYRVTIKSNKQPNFFLWHKKACIFGKYILNGFPSHIMWRGKQHNNKLVELKWIENMYFFLYLYMLLVMWAREREWLLQVNIYWVSLFSCFVAAIVWICSCQHNGKMIEMVDFQLFTEMFVIVAKLDEVWLR